MITKSTPEEIKIVQLFDIEKQPDTPKMLFTGLVNLVLLDPPFRPITVRILVKLIHLIINNVKNTGFLVDNNLITTLREYCLKNVSNIQKLMSFKTLTEVVLNNFENSSREFE